MDINISELMAQLKEEEKKFKVPTQSCNISEVYDKYKSLTGYRVTVKTIKKGVLTSTIKIGGRVSKKDALQLAEVELERFKRKYKIV